MIEIIVIVALVALLALERYQDRKERARLVNALLSRTPQEFKELEEASAPVKPNIQNSNELLSLDQLSDEDWYKAEIKNEKVKLP